MIGYDDLMENELEIYIERERGRVELKCTGCIDLVDETTFVGEKCCLSVIFHLLVEVSDFSSGSVYIFFSQLLAFLLFNRKSISAVGNLFRFFNREEKFQSMCDTRATAPSNIWTRKVYFV